MSVAGESAARSDLVARLGFDLDRFQHEALDALDAGQSVLVAAPTGSGKTVVAEYAVELALRTGGKAFYTTPIKALSNQKFGDLARAHGLEHVGLLTGDNAINGDAPVVVMTTEVLRNMIYARSPALEGLQFVVLDEVHYLQDAYRGPVWEEVIIHLPAAVRVVCLSATVSNAHELADWISTVRGPTAAVLEQKRPVDLHNLYVADDRSNDKVRVLPVVVDGQPNPEGFALDVESPSFRGGLRPGRGRPPRRFGTPRRLEIVDLLDDRNLLPAIYFIFSRAACDDAMRACVEAGVRLTLPEERAQIREIVEAHTSALSEGDLDVLGYDRWLSGLEHGIAAHHAGMVPPFKEAVESCFAAGLVKVVFATETLALGINMPARTVAIERLTKFGGDRHEFLTPGEYTQLTGRAGRRGIDSVGHAVVLWSPFVSFDQVATLVMSRTFRLRSAFRPTYNMAANLVASCAAEEAHHLLNLSFGQYQADRSVVELEKRLETERADAAAAASALTCEHGDVREYAALMARVAAATEKHYAPARPRLALTRRKPGSVVDVVTSKYTGRGIVMTWADRPPDTKVMLLKPNGKTVSLGRADFAVDPEPVGKLALPGRFNPHDRGLHRSLLNELAAMKLPPAPPVRSSESGGLRAARAAAEVHPVAACPDARRHIREARRLVTLEHRAEQTKHQIEQRGESLARTFDRVLQVLEGRSYLAGWALTEQGRRLGRIFHESDLLIAEAMHGGLLDGLDPASCAGLVSCFTYEHRSAQPPPPPWFPSKKVRHRFADLVELARSLANEEQGLQLPPTRPPDAGFLALAHAWAAGEDLDDVLYDEDLSGGDFVRNIKQLIDLLRQVGQIAPVPETARTARAAADALFRGVVAASSTVTTADAEVPAEGENGENGEEDAAADGGGVGVRA